MDLPTFNVLSLFSGYGMFDLGLSLAVPSARTVCMVEREAKACERLATLMQAGCLDDAPVWTDARTFDGRPWRGVVDCVAGGYPCQGESAAGKGLGVDDPRWMWPEFRRIVQQCEPRWVFCENVGMHLRRSFRVVSDDLRAMGYRVKAGLFTAAEVGASHQRERLFILAHSEESRGWVVPGSSDEEDQQVRRKVHLGGSAPQAGRADTAGSVMADADLGVGHVQGVVATPRGDSCSHGIPRPIHVEQPGGFGCDLPFFPPGPADLDGWRAVLATSPHLEPAVCRMADGSSDRVDRLRGLGNGVVPLQAAYAFLTLHAAFQGR